jgi:hypothetical protein
MSLTPLLAVVAMAMPGTSLQQSRPGVTQSLEQATRERLRGAESVLVPGGRSPDGQFEVRVFKDKREPSDYSVALVERASGRILTILEGGGYRSFETVKDFIGGCCGESARTVDSALWHDGSRFVAVTDGGTKTSRELYVYELRETDAGAVRAVDRIALPNYEQNALGRVRATAIANSSVAPIRWVGDVLESTLNFRAERRLDRQPAEVVGDFDVTVRIKLEWSRSQDSPSGPSHNGPASARLDSMGTPTRARRY